MEAQPGPRVLQRAQLQYPLDLESEGALKLALENVGKDVIRRRNRIQTVLLSGATFFNVASDYMVMTAQAAVTIATIGGGREGQILTLQFGDANITITDTGTGAADTVNLGSAFVSSANATLQLLYDGISWREVGRSSSVGLTDISARASTASSNALTANVWFTIPLNLETYDTDTMHDTVTNNSRITFTTAGKYHIDGWATFTAGKTHGLRVLLGGATVIAKTTAGNALGGEEDAMSISLDYEFAAGNYIELQAITANTATNVTTGVLSAHKFN